MVSLAPPHAQADRQRAQLEEAKQAAAVAAARAEAETKAREEEDRRVALEHHAQQLAAKTAALPAEPPVGTADTTAVLVKLPDGTRLSRRYRPSSFSLPVSPVSLLSSSLALTLPFPLCLLSRGGRGGLHIGIL